MLGDDFLCTNPRRIRRAVDAGAATALLLKVNQIGTLTEAAEALRLARAAGWRVTVSARSGETEDDWLADLAVGWGGDQIKVGLDHAVRAAGQVQPPAGDRIPIGPPCRRVAVKARESGSSPCNQDGPVVKSRPPKVSERNGGAGRAKKCRRSS